MFQDQLVKNVLLLDQIIEKLFNWQNCNNAFTMPSK